MRGVFLDKRDKNNACYRQDFTLSLDKHYLKYAMKSENTESIAKLIKELLRECCDRYVFQAEITGDSNFHFQGRVNLKTKCRWRTSTFRKELENIVDPETGKCYFYDIYTSPTNSNCRNWNYVTKPETRLFGPWADRPVFQGKSIYNRNQLRGWHCELLDLVENHNKDGYSWRKIHHVLDVHGSNQKSSFARYLMYNHANDVGMVNSFGTASQLNSSLVSMGARKMYIIDLPRSFSELVEKEKKVSKPGEEDKFVTVSYRTWHKNWPEMANVIEQLKNGMLLCTMYGKSDLLLMDPPTVIIFSNWPLENKPGHRFSADRLEVMDLSSKKYMEDKPEEENSVHFVPDFL